MIGPGTVGILAPLPELLLSLFRWVGSVTLNGSMLQRVDQIATALHPL